MKLLSIAIVTLATAAAYAKSNTEYFFQPAGGASALELDYQMNSYKTDTDPSTTEVKHTTGDLLIDYGYGLSESATVGISTFTGSDKAESGGVSETASGMGDVHLYYKGMMDVWHYGVDLGISTAKAKFKAGGTRENRTTGGMSLAGNFGGLWTSNAMNYGFNFTLLAPLERSYEGASGAGGKITGTMSEKLAAFGEYNYGMGFVGAELGYTNVGETTTKPDAGGESKTKAFGVTDIMLYGSYDFSDMVSGLLSYEMDMFPSYEDGASKTKAYTTSMVTIGARINF